MGAGAGAGAGQGRPTIAAMSPARSSPTPPPGLSAAATPARYAVAVRSLCEFAAKQGDLDLRFTPAPSAQQGQAGHQTVAARRGTHYQTELPLAGQHRHLRVQGRADGYDPSTRRLEEIKTFRGDLSRQPANHRVLHWAQAQVYGALLCQQRGLTQLTLALVYFDIGRQQEASTLTRECSAAELQAFFETLCERFLQWADQELAHRAQRDAGLAALRFPHPDFRPGQRQLAESVFKASRAGRCLMAQAPTGIGKTVGTLFPLLKAMAAQAIDKAVFLTAKGSGRGLALDAVSTLRASAPDLALRVINLVARDKACEHPELVCQGDSCPLARGFYDRLPAARVAAAQQASLQTLSQGILREIALAHQVCPYYLGQEMARWCDLMVGDYNHWFDASALLHGLAQANHWQAAVLVDEAHNLLERGRAMYSATLNPAPWRALRLAAPAVLKKPLDRLHRQWSQLGRDHPEPYTALDVPPAALCAALQDVTTAIGDFLVDVASPAGAPASAEVAQLFASPTGADAALRFASPTGARPPLATGVGSALMAVYFEALQFNRLLETFGPHSIFDLTQPEPSPPGRRAAQPSLCLRNLMPAPFLQPRLEAARSVTLFSATLTPQPFYANTLGVPANTTWLDVTAPFRPEQLRVQIARGLSTRFAHRAGSLAPLTDLIASEYRRRPGNYLAFFSSFDYLQQAVLALAQRHPQLPIWQQDRRMDEAQRAAFLARFSEGGQGIGFAVLGGLFAEGIDLPGTRLIGAFIATLGLPQFNPVNEALRRRQQQVFGAGYDYTYLYPGIRKVVQAAGRVIRSLSDSGSLHLIDDRFARPEVLRLLPAWWRIEPEAAPAAPACPLPAPGAFGS